MNMSGFIHLAGWVFYLNQAADHELIYASHEVVFALLMRNERLSHYYVQCPAGDSVEQWSDDRFWDTLKRQIPSAIANNLGRVRRLKNQLLHFVFCLRATFFWAAFIAGDAGHIVPPTGAKD